MGFEKQGLDSTSKQLRLRDPFSVVSGSPTPVMTPCRLAMHGYTAFAAQIQTSEHTTIQSVTEKSSANYDESKDMQSLYLRTHIIKI